MSMFAKYFSFSISITFISWIVGLILIVPLKQTAFYKNRLSGLNFISNPSLNRILGLGNFKWMVKNTFFKFFNPKLQLKSKADLADLVQLRDEMTLAEVSHLIAFVFVSGFAAVMFAKLKLASGLVMMLVNIILNLYPSLLQQENKRRIAPFIQRLRRTANV